MRRFSAVALLAFIAFAAAAMPAQAQTNWNGFYVGINGGGSWGSVNTAASDTGPDNFFSPANIPAVTAGAAGHIKTSGGLAGGQLGYLYQWNAAIVGVDAGFDWSGLSGSAHNGPTAYPANPTSTFAWNLQAKQDWLFTFLGRAGVDMGTWYPYVTAGVAVTRETYSANFVDTFYPTNVTNTFSRVVAGPALGAGAEIHLFDHWLLRGEYLYTQFDGVGGNGPIACIPGVGACAAPTVKTTFAFKTSTFVNNIVRVAVSYKF